MQKFIKILLFFIAAITVINLEASMKLEIINIENESTNPNSALRNDAAIVEFPLKKRDKILIDSMKKRLYQLGGVGLAAPQVNIKKRIILVYIPEDAAALRDDAKPYPMHVMINPEYQPITAAGMEEDFEGCYSVKSRAGKVKRYNSIQINYQDEKGKKITSTEHGFYARVLQHEVDHLNSTLIIDHLDKNAVQGSPEEMAKLRRSQLDKEKLKVLDGIMKKRTKK